MVAGGATRTMWTPIIESFLPRITPLEAVDHWAGSRDILGERTGWLRPFEIATWYIIPIAIVADKLVVSPRLASGALTSAQAWVMCPAAIAIGTCLLAIAAKLVMRSSLERRVSALDEGAALAIVIDSLNEGLAKNPARRPAVVKVLRSTLGTLPG